jgi:LmbE family N-acetylglucosaminyl deacetylase
MRSLERPINERDHANLNAAVAHASVSDPRALVGAGPVFVLAPHPDDESIGCGGLIAACSEAGIPVFVRVLTDGRHSHPGSSTWPPDRVALQREREAQRACACLGVAATALRFERAIDGTLLFDWQRARQIADHIAAAARQWPAPVVVAPWRGDPHPDHMAAAVIADMIETLCSGARGLRYLVWGDANAAPSAARRFPIGPWREQKRSAILAHESQTGWLIGDGLGRALVPDLTHALGAYEYYLTSAA